MSNHSTKAHNLQANEPALSLYPNAKCATTKAQITISKLYEDIQTGEYIKQAENLHEVIRAGGNIQKAKAAFPAVTISGLVTSGGRKNAMQESRFKHSGFLQIDIDKGDLGNLRPEDCRDTLAEDEHIMLAFLSPTHTGAKAIMCIPVCHTVEQHKAAFTHAEEYIYGRYGWKIDGKTKDPARLCYVSDDIDAKLNPGASVLPVKVSDSLSYSSELSKLFVSSTSSVSSIYLPSLKDRIAASNNALEDLKKNKALHKLYHQWVETKLTPQQGERNSQLVAMVTFLSRAVSPKRVMELAQAYHSVNQDLFMDGLEQHMEEAKAHLTNTLELWMQDIPLEEIGHLDGLPDQYIATFRICRELASIEAEEAPRGQFYLSYNDLAGRLETKPTQAMRIMRSLEGCGCLEIKEKGQRWEKGRGLQEGKKGKATTYKWLWSLATSPPPNEGSQRRPQ